jgi:hypothetical protein
MTRSHEGHSQPLGKLTWSATVIIEMRMHLEGLMRYQLFNVVSLSTCLSFDQDGIHGSRHRGNCSSGGAGHAREQPSGWSPKNLGVSSPRDKLQTPAKTPPPTRNTSVEQRRGCDVLPGSHQVRRKDHERFPETLACCRQVPIDANRALVCGACTPATFACNVRDCDNHPTAL